MEKVTGIGGIFFRSRNPVSLSQWYAEHLGIDALPTVWQQQAGPTVFEPFKHDTDYFGRKVWPGMVEANHTWINSSSSLDS